MVSIKTLISIGTQFFNVTMRVSICQGVKKGKDLIVVSLRQGFKSNSI